MNPQQQRITIARSIGWKESSYAGGIGSEYGPEECWTWISPTGEHIGNDDARLPDYINNLNDAAGLIEWLWKHKDLACVCDNACGRWQVIFLRYNGDADGMIQFTGDGETLALAICEAFLRTLNLYDETK